MRYSRSSFAALVAATILAVRSAARIRPDQAQVGARVRDLASRTTLQALWAAAEINKRTNGRYQIDVFPASTLGKETDINQALSLGTIDIIYTGMAFAGRTYPPMSIASGAVHLPRLRPLAEIPQRPDLQGARQGLRGQERRQPHRGLHLLRRSATSPPTSW